MHFVAQCLVIALLSSTAVFAADSGERATGFRPPPRAKNLIYDQTAHNTSKRSLLKSSATPAIPSKWDSRDHGWITPVRDQGEIEACWTFAAYATLEAQLLKTGRGEYDFSEKNMANLHGFPSKYDVGGHTDMAIAYLLRWGGAIAETNDVFTTSKSNWTDSPTLNPAIHVQNIVWVPVRTSFTDNDTLKVAITNYGAVATSMHWDDGYAKGEAYYCNDANNLNHAIAVIGWDDTYEASNFKNTPKGDGAWLIKNSWGEFSGNKGYYYVSYYDATFAFGWPGTVFIPATEDEDYTAVYGYDKLGYISSGDYNCDQEAAVFTSSWNEEVAAVGVYSTISPNPYIIEVYTNVTRGASSPTDGGTLACSISGTIDRLGYITIPLQPPVRLKDKSNFTIVFKQEGATHSHALNYSCNYNNGTPYAICDHPAGNTYLKATNGEWKDAATFFSNVSACVCLKAYTRSIVPASDGPSETDDGTSMLKTLYSTNATLYAETGETFGAFANLVGANGRTLWSSWLAGFDPADKDDNKLVVDISVTNNVPYLSWTPNLGADRSYRILGRETLDEEDWEEVGDLKTTSAKFFKVTVEQ